MKICKNCLSSLSDNDVVCPKCGFLTTIQTENVKKRRKNKALGVILILLSVALIIAVVVGVCVQLG